MQFFRWPGLDDPWPGGDEEDLELLDRGRDEAIDFKEEEEDFLSSLQFRLQLDEEIESRGPIGSGAAALFRWW